jgi:hypothetical protein
MTKKIYWKDFLPILKESLEEYKELMNDCENDKYKIYYLPHEVIYNGWGDYYGHERKNRKAYWAKGYELMNIDTITYEELRYYLNNRLYRKDYLEMIPFLKRIYLYKKEEYDKETPFVKLLMKKTGIDDEKRVREALTWWKIKNKWKRWLETDDAKAYRMLCRKLCGGGEV